MKRVVSFMLVLVIVCALIIPAHAYDENNITLRGPVAQCPGCHYPSTDTITVTADSYQLTASVDACVHTPSSHEHTHVYDRPSYSKCIHCGYTKLISRGTYMYTLCSYSSSGIL